jgi:phosphoribosylformylglycinamidine (FGAM) synthase-like amidotransferase family enzyme
MPHPERGVDDLLGSSDGAILLEWFLHTLVPA